MIRMIRTTLKTSRISHFGYLKDELFSIVFSFRLAGIAPLGSVGRHPGCFKRSGSDGLGVCPKSAMDMGAIGAQPFFGTGLYVAIMLVGVG